MRLEDLHFGALCEECLKAKKSTSTNVKEIKFNSNKSIYLCTPCLASLSDLIENYSDPMKQCKHCKEEFTCSCALLPTKLEENSYEEISQ